MALIVEDGTGLPNADSYQSVAGASAYHLAMGNSEWSAATEPQQEAALRRATQYMDTRYQWIGKPLTTTQALALPRDLIVLPNKRVQDACSELALRVIKLGDLYTDQDSAAVTQETVGPISVSYDTAQNRGQVRFTLVDDLLSGLVRNVSRMTLRIERAS